MALLLHARTDGRTPEESAWTRAHGRSVQLVTERDHVPDGDEQCVMDTVNAKDKLCFICIRREDVERWKYGEQLTSGFTAGTGLH